ncbi:MAG: helix-turn-helix transcriptional regulator [Oscillospiraceae bacterium]|nr:helix-turn-helix transcriptional regulator [Oscillospiraceae bacterium]
MYLCTLLHYQEHSSGFNADVISARLALAKRLLKTTDISVNETARSCGYDDESYFMKLFKKQFGITALAYRKR